MKKLISIIIPAFNEEEVIPKLSIALSKAMNELSAYTFEVIVVEHGSKDNTLKELLKIRKKDSRIKILQLAKNVGCDGGIIAGLSYAKGDAAIVMMADLQDDTNLFPKLIKKWEEGYDVVYTYITKRIKVKLYKKIGAAVFYYLMDILSKGLVPQNVSDFRLIDKTVYNSVINMPEHNKFFRGLVAWTGFNQIGIPTVRLERAAGTPKSDFKTLFKVGLNGLFSFSNIPLKIPWFLSFIFLVGGLGSLFLTNFMVSILLLSFASVSFLIGIQSEYIIKILEESRKRPNFIVKNSYGIKR